MRQKIVKPLILLVTFLFIGCGVSGEDYNYNPQNSTYNMTENLSQSIWHDGDAILSVNKIENVKTKAYVEPFMLLEDGLLYDNVLVNIAGEKSKAVYGIYQLDIPDADEVTFFTKIGFSQIEKPTDDVFTFNISLQEGDEFPTLANLETTYDHVLDVMEVDLTLYRGRFIFLILSVKTKSENPELMKAIWLDPKINYEYF